MGARAVELRRAVVARLRCAGAASAIGAHRPDRCAAGFDRERAARRSSRREASRVLRPRPDSRLHQAALSRSTFASGRYRKLARHLQSNAASGARCLWGNFRRGADTGQSRCRRAHASITAFRSSDHGGDRATRRFFRCFPFRQSLAQTHRPDAAADAESQGQLTLNGFSAVRI